MVWYVLTSCGNLSLETPLNNWTTMIPENYDLFDTDEELQSYLRNNWLYIGDSSVETLKNKERKETEYKQAAVRFVSDEEAILKFYGQDKRGAWDTREINFRPGFIDIFAVEDYIDRMIGQAKTERLTNTNFYGNFSCCKICVWKSETTSIPKLHKSDIELLFS